MSLSLKKVQHQSPIPEVYFDVSTADYFLLACADDVTSPSVLTPILDYGFYILKVFRIVI